MTLFLDRVVGLLEDIAPLRYAESWDNVGLLLAPLGDRLEDEADLSLPNVLLGLCLNQGVAPEEVQGLGLKLLTNSWVTLAASAVLPRPPIPKMATRRHWPATSHCSTSASSACRP